METERPLTLSSLSTLPECRICLSHSPKVPVINPCNCRGSASIHFECLNDYLTHKYNHATKHEKQIMEQQLRCELCKRIYHNYKLVVRKTYRDCGQICEEREQRTIIVAFLLGMILIFIFYGVGAVIHLINGATWLFTIIWYSVVFGLNVVLVVLVGGAFHRAITKTEAYLVNVKEKKETAKPRKIKSKASISTDRKSRNNKL